MEDHKEIIKQLSRPLDISDVDFRLQSINKAGYATILAYKDARVDMNRLDYVCGGLWQKEYKYVESKGLLFCRVGIMIGKEWVWREDLGTESFSEKEKGHASDSFKRACFNWGIGRDLYEYPLIQVKLNPSEFKLENDKAKQTWALKLSEWDWKVSFDSKDRIETLTAYDGNNKLRYSYSNLKKEPVKKVLEILDNEKNYTIHWSNLLKAVSDKKVTSIEKVKERYFLSAEIEDKVTELFNQKK